MIEYSRIMYHTYLAHLLWKDFLRPGMTVIDATAGNGNDTLFLAKCVLTPNSGWVHAFDIQREAIENTRNRIQTSLKEELQRRVILHEASHEVFPEGLSPSLIVYNLGYLPHGDTSKTTFVETTLTSCKNAVNILGINGMISITVYPGHPEGVREKEALLNWLNTLSSYSIFHHTPFNNHKSPSIITLRMIAVK